MNPSMRVMTEQPLNAETPTERLRTWITANDIFFDRNQGRIPEVPVSLTDYVLSVEGEVENPLTITYDQLINLPKGLVANTLECSGNGRSLLQEKASGNPWTVGGVGNAVWGGAWLLDILEMAAPKDSAFHVAFDGMDEPLGSKGVSFVRSIPIEKARASTLLAYEMNGDPLPLKHGFPVRALALGWTGANCVKWLKRITLLDRPYEGFFMDNVYRVFQKGQDSKSGEVVTALKLKSIITQPLNGASLSRGGIAIRGAAYGGQEHVERIELSTDGGASWQAGVFIGPDEPYAWRQWEYIWKVEKAGQYSVMARATDARGQKQPLTAQWNKLGYGTNGVREHAVTVTIY
jgi:DMSO/TMAO reductase YedYZ molybdopterin-dependent catalytic subunit